MEISEWLTIAAIIIGPLSVFFLEKLWRRREWRSRRKEEVFYNLIRDRAVTRSGLNAEEMEQAINAVPVVFSGNQPIIDAYNTFYEEMTSQNSSSDSKKEKLIELIQTISREMGFDEIDESSIEKVIYFT